MPSVIMTEADEIQALSSIKAGKGELVALSDFDGTLCDTYGFDPATNNHPCA
jgi:hypothetical protein